VNPLPGNPARAPVPRTTTRTPLPLVLAPALLCGCPDHGVESINATPVATILSHQDGATLDEGAELTFVGSAADADHPPETLSVSWYLAGQALCTDLLPDQDGTTTCVATVGSEGGDLVLQVRDPKNAVGTDSVAVTVQPTSAPTAAITAPEDGGTYAADALITFEGVVADAEDAAEALTCW